MDVFAQARDRVTAREAATRYGLEIKRDFAFCPFHGEKTASLHFHGNQFYCFGCGAKGSSIDFVALLFGLDPLGAVRRLNDDFCLGLPLDGPPTAQEKREARERRDKACTLARFEQWRTGLLRDLNACIRKANTLDIQAYEEMKESDVLALAWREAITSWADVLEHGTAAEQMEVFRQRQEVEPLARRILAHI